MGNILNLQIIFLFILIAVGTTIGFLVSRELKNVGKNNSLDFISLKEKHAVEEQAEQYAKTQTTS